MDFTLVESKKKNYLKLKNKSDMNAQTQTQFIKTTYYTKPITSNTPITPITNTKPENDKPEQEKKILSQEEMTEVLISKIKNNENIDIKIKEINKEKGLFFAINVRADLTHIGNGVFHSAKLNTVSHINRVVNIKLVFSDNENLHHDMKINSDAIIQCFREVAPDTITSIHIETFKDQIENEHLSLILSTIKGSSLTYVYRKMIEFVTIINEKYGVLPSPVYKQISINDIANEMQQDLEQLLEKQDLGNPARKQQLLEKQDLGNPARKQQLLEKAAPKISVNDLEQDLGNPSHKQQDLENPARKQQDLENPAHKQQDLENPARKHSANDSIDSIRIEKQNELTKVKNEIKDNKTLINNSILNVIENLEKEEKRLLLELENVRKLLKSQNSILDISQSQVPDKVQVPAQSQVTEQIKIQENTNTLVKKNSFAYKVMYGNN
jgi:hypothetical protein